jgi:glycosyltransferase involved in cell wall biosynthesis
MFVHILDDRAISRLVGSLSLRLQEMGVDVRVVGAQSTASGMQRLPASLAFDSLGLKFGGTALATPRLARWVRRHRPDIVFAHGNGPNRAAILAAALARVPTAVVTVEHNHYPTFYGRHWRRDLPTRLLYPRAARVGAVSPGALEALETLFPAVRGRTVLLASAGPDPEDLRARLATPPDHPWLATPRSWRVICSVANVVPRKGQDALVDALPAVQATAGDVRLLLVGRLDDPEFAARLRARADELGVGEAVDLTGYREDPLPLVAASDAFALASHTEGMPMSLVEALACGVPAVATDCPTGPAHVLDDGRAGLLVPVGDVAGLGAALTRLLIDDEARRRLITAGRERADSFTPAAVARRFLEVAEACRPLPAPAP